MGADREHDDAENEAGRTGERIETGHYGVHLRHAAKLMKSEVPTVTDWQPCPVVRRG